MNDLTQHCVVHVCRDLMLTGKISAWARRADVCYCNVAGLDALEQWFEQSERPDAKLFLVDLQCPSLDMAALVALIRKATPASCPPPVIGYAQHVMTELLDTARSVGFDRVLTRGQFDRQFAELIHEVVNA